MKSAFVLATILLAVVVPSARAGHYDELGQWCGDPQFTGLDGRVFYFDGIAGMNFNILSEQARSLPS